MSAYGLIEKKCLFCDYDNIANVQALINIFREKN